MPDRSDLLRAVSMLLPHHELYIELGISSGSNLHTIAPYFDRVIAVDCDARYLQNLPPNTEAFHGTTDEFFQSLGGSLKGQVDLIFIDACHDFENSWRDFQNAMPLIRHFQGLIALHDVYPPCEEYIHGFCCDTYKTAVEIRKLRDWEFVTVPGDCGVGLVRYAPGKQTHWQ